MADKIYDVDGSYITVPQIKFFFNRDQGRINFLLSGGEFRKYLRICKIYNLVSDLVNEFPDDGFFYWDDDKGCVSFAFKEDSTISNLLDDLNVTTLDFGDG